MNGIEISNTMASSRNGGKAEGSRGLPGDLGYQRKECDEPLPFEIILDVQKSCKVVLRVSRYPSPNFP